MASVYNITRRLSQLAVRKSSNFIGSSNTLRTETLANFKTPKNSLQQVPVSVRTFSSDEKGGQDQQWANWQNSLLKKEGDAPTIKRRGGKALNKKKEVVESLSSQERLLEGAGPGQFPPLRFSDEETERLLKEAYSKIPKKAGGKKTRRKKRMANKFNAIRKARAIKKKEKVEHHFDRMEKRSFQLEGINRMKELAVEVRVEDQEYQAAILQQWAEFNGVNSVSAKSEVVEGGGDAVSNLEK